VMPKRNNGFTFVELILAVSLSAFLLTIAGGFLFNMTEFSARAIADSLTSRQLEFCIETLRKEIQESRTDGTDPLYAFLGGDGTISFATSRTEIIARSEVPRGYLRIEWHFDEARGTLGRSVGALSRSDGRAGKTHSIELLKNIERLSFWRYDGKKWFPITGSPTSIPDAVALKLEITFRSDASPVSQQTFSTAFVMPR